MTGSDDELEVTDPAPPIKIRDIDTNEMVDELLDEGDDD